MAYCDFPPLQPVKPCNGVRRRPRAIAQVHRRLRARYSWLTPSGTIRVHTSSLLATSVMSAMANTVELAASSGVVVRSGTADPEGWRRNYLCRCARLIASSHRGAANVSATRMSPAHTLIHPHALGLERTVAGLSTMPAVKPAPVCSSPRASSVATASGSGVVRTAARPACSTTPPPRDAGP